MSSKSNTNNDQDDSPAPDIHTSASKKLIEAKVNRNYVGVRSTRGQLKIGDGSFIGSKMQLAFSSDDCWLTTSDPTIHEEKTKGGKILHRIRVRKYKKKQSKTGDRKYSGAFGTKKEAELGCLEFRLSMESMKSKELVKKEIDKIGLHWRKRKAGETIEEDGNADSAKKDKVVVRNYKKKQYMSSNPFVRCASNVPDLNPNTAGVFNAYNFRYNVAQETFQVSAKRIVCWV